MRKTPRPPVPRVVWSHTYRTIQLRWETQEATLSNTVHWDMFLLLQVWRQSCARTQSMCCGGGLLTDDGGESCRKAAVAFDLLASRCTIMRSNSALTPPHLPSLPFPLFLHSCLSPIPSPVATPTPLVGVVTVLRPTLGLPRSFSAPSPGKKNLTCVLLTKGFCMYLHYQAIKKKTCKYERVTSSNQYPPGRLKITRMIYILGSRGCYLVQVHRPNKSLIQMNQE